jgi:hypothetical protein
MELRQTARRVTPRQLFVLVAAMLVALMLGVVAIGRQSPPSTSTNPHATTVGLTPDRVDQLGDPYSPHDPIGAPFRDPYSPHDPLVK